MEPNSVLQLEPRLNAFIHSLNVFDHLLYANLIITEYNRKRTCNKGKNTVKWKDFNTNSAVTSYDLEQVT